MTHWTLITGASEGLGAEFARIAAAEGRNLILTARSKDKLNALATELQSDRVEVVVIPADLSDADDAARLWIDASKNRRIDMIMNNAGLGRHGTLADQGGWARELSSIMVNVVGLTYLTKRGAQHMLQHGGGAILNVASTAGFMPGPNMAAYHATKAYALSLSEAVAEELSGTGVTVTALCPGATQTEFFEGAGMHGVRLLKLGKPMAARPVAQAGWDAALQGRRVIVTGVLNKFLTFAPRISPRRVVTLIAKQVMGKGR
jgi:short-subunit dehydrogenase